MQEKVTGMVLSGTPIGEYDKRLVILTKERGKISAFARGARRPKNSLMAASEPFTFGEFFVYRGRDSYTITGVDVKNYFADMRDELEDIYMGMYFCEVADYFTRENMDAKNELLLLYQSMRALKVPSLNRELVRLIFELKMIALNGEAPRIFECAACGKKEEIFYFCREGSCILCQECNEKPPYGGKGTIPISGTTTYILQRIVASDLESLYTFTVKESVQREMKQVIHSYFSDKVKKSFSALEMFELLEMS